MLVTGAGQGIGRATAQSLAEEGASLALVDFDAARLDTAAKELADLTKVLALPTDISDEAAVATTVEAAVAHFGGLGGLANIAGVSDLGDGPVADVSTDTFDRVLRVNLRGTFLMCRATVPHLLAAGGGTIVNMSSAGALPGIKNGGATAYNASKAGILGLTRSLASQYAEQNVRCVAVCPGATETPMLEVAHRKLGRAAVAPPRTLPRSAQPREVADLVAFLIGDTGSYVTGSTWAIDGNMTGY